jgi:hypothetical protein
MLAQEAEEIGVLAGHAEEVHLLLFEPIDGGHGFGEDLINDFPGNFVDHVSSIRPPGHSKLFAYWQTIFQRNLYLLSIAHAQDEKIDCMFPEA